MKEKPNFWLFNLGADIYAWFTAQAAWRDSCARVAAHLVDIGHEARIVDLGCGPGVSTFELARLLPTARLIGVDVAPRMLRQAQRRAPDKQRITWLRADAARLPIASASVHACTGHSFLYLVANRSAVLSEVRRVLKPGGRVVLMEPNARGATPRQALAVSHDPRHLVSVTLWRPYSLLHGRFSTDSLVETLEGAGFVDARAEETFGGFGVVGCATKS